jgi:hypothetical protein
MRDYCGSARHVTQDCNLADDVVLAERGHLDRTSGRVDQDVGLTLEDDVGRIAIVALMKQLVARDVLQTLAGEPQQLELGRVDRGEQRNVAQDLHVLGQAHG